MVRRKIIFEEIHNYVRRNSLMILRHTGDYATAQGPYISVTSNYYFYNDFKDDPLYSSYTNDIVSQVTDKCRVKFISYEPMQDAICKGKLRLKIDGVIYSFVSKEYKSAETNDKISFWKSGGYIDYNGNVYQGNWIIYEDCFKSYYPELQQYIRLIHDIVIEKFPDVCCGKCLNDPSRKYWHHADSTFW